MRRDDSDNSLDLFLDAICNAFGGILFLALLSALLLRMGHEAQLPQPVDSSTEAELLEFQTELIEAMAELEALQRAIAEQALLLQQFAPEESREELQQYYEAAAQRDSASARKKQRLAQIAEVRTEINQAIGELNNLEQGLKDAQQNLQAAQAAWADEVRSRTRDIELPRARSTSKREYAICVRYGRLYCIYKPERYPEKELNSQDIAVLEDGAAQMRATPKPYVGMVISDEPGCQEAIAEKLRSLSPGRYYLAVAVWDDSFESFAAVRQALVRAGYEYRLIPVPHGESIFERYVANPQVQ